VGFEPDSKMNQPKSKVNVEKIIAGLKKGDKLPPLLVRKYKDGYQVLDGHHRFWAYKLSGTKSIPVRIVADKDIEEIGKQGVAEGFDQPYPLKWEKSEYGDIDALAKLPDGSPLSIMFNLADMSENDWGVEFYRNNSQSVTGEGDAQRVFATVLNAIGQFIKKKKPDTLFFTAVKEEDPTGSRAKLYDRLVQKYATGLGYDLKKVDYPEQTGYRLTRKEQGVAENKLPKPYKKWAS
jgi:hypothetical protein